MAMSKLRRLASNGRSGNASFNGRRDSADNTPHSVPGNANDGSSNATSELLGDAMTTGAATASEPSPPSGALTGGYYAQRCRELMIFNKDLRALGATNMLDLPTITVIGGQSAGKSSLVEAVSGITVPRDSGTCTRCPMECVMSSAAESWSCNISLRFDHDEQVLEPKDDYAIHPAGSAHEIQFGPTITDRSAVEIWLRRAQAAMLSPHRMPQEFYNQNAEELRNSGTDPRRLKFSRNAVCLTLRDPAIINLLFVDLPGLIQNEEPENIQVVRDLSISRIEQQQTLILVTIPASDDMQNQQAMRLARNVDPSGQRTIAVLTKPDSLGAGDIGRRSQWKEVLDGDRDALAHGYYCVRLPDDAQRSRGMTRAQCDAQAQLFFDSTAPWSEVLDRTRFGVGNLAAFLSKLLTERIEANLPQLRAQVHALLKRHTEELNGLPPAPDLDHAAVAVFGKISAFCNAFRAAVAGTERKSFVQDCRTKYGQFKSEIQRTTPDFRPFHGHERFRDPLIAFDEVDYVASTIPPIDLPEVQLTIRDATSWELPDQVPFHATIILVQRFTSNWKEPAMSCFEGTVSCAEALLCDLTHEHFGQFNLLKRFVTSLVTQELAECKDLARQTLEKFRSLDESPLFTQNRDLFRTQKAAWSARYKAAHDDAGSYYLPGRHLYVREGHGYESELDLMATVRAYWQIAYRRIIDYVPLVIEREFNQCMASRLEPVLIQNLLRGPDMTTRLRDLLAEDSAISAKRAFLHDRISRLIEIQRKLDGLGQSRDS
ncbi:unnamed protein product [Mycena citricolor]|uniref:Uncharacterized protein n=1 Tax=Mycena citricolor TaxID=2018698 RepID=A0AAD2HM11_9AGAR|nr:unnamed protein product [Mycena citricolor]